VPTTITWKGIIKPGISDALIGQNDWLASMASLLNQSLPANAAPDSENLLDALLNKSANGRESFVEQGMTGMAIIKGDWKYIPPNQGPAKMKDKDMELGNAAQPQLYNIKEDKGEKNNLATQYPEKVKELAALLVTVQNGKK